MYSKRKRFIHFSSLRYSHAGSAISRSDPVRHRPTLRIAVEGRRRFSPEKREAYVPFRFVSPTPGESKENDRPATGFNAGRKTANFYDRFGYIFIRLVNLPSFGESAY